MANSVVHHVQTGVIKVQQDEVETAEVPTPVRAAKPKPKAES